MMTQESNDILKFDDLAISVFEWAKDKNLIVKGNEFSQIHKVKEEIDEIVEAIQSQNIEKIRDEIVDEDDGRRQDAFSEFGVKKIAFGQLKFGMGFAVESHPKFKISLHLLLKKGKYKTNTKKRNFRVRLFFTEICNRLLYQAA